MKDFPNKRDFYYIVGFLIITIVVVFSGRLADNTLFVDYIGFSGTIVSILLAVIAIIYSFYQSSTYENANHKLDTSANKIEEATAKLSNVSQIKDMMEDFKREVKSLKDSLEEVKNKVVSMDDVMQKTYNEGLASNNTNKEGLKENYTQEYFDTFVTNTSKISLLVLLEALRVYEEKDRMDLSQLTKKYFKHVNKKKVPTDADIIKFVNAEVGMLSTYNTMGFLEVKEKANNFRIAEINEKLLKSISDIRKDILENSEHAFHEFLKNQNNDE
jgi:hypothetical protein